MDGNIFFSNRFDPSSEAIAFNFDLQRFASGKISVTQTGEKFTFEGDETPYNTKDEATNAAAKAAGAKFYVTNGETTTYYTEDSEFNTNNLTGGTNITILGDINLASAVNVNLGADKDNVIKVVGTATLNLGANNLTINRTGTVSSVDISNPASAIVVQDGANFTVKGTTGTIDYTWQPATDLSTIKKRRTCAAIQIGNKVGEYSDDLSSTSKATFNMESGTVQSYSTVVSMSDNGILNVNGGTITSTNSCGVYYGNDSPGGGTINVKGGTIETQETSQLPAIQVSGLIGNKTGIDSSLSYDRDKLAKPAIITVTGGTIAHKGTSGVTKDASGNITKINGNPNAICASGNVDLTISGGTITSTGTAVEIRVGSLNVTGGTITSTASDYFVEDNKPGGSSYGVALDIAQHKTKQAIDVNISGTANISGVNAVAVANPMANQSDSPPVTATIDGGNLTSTKKDDTKATTGNALLADKSNVVITVNGGNLNGNVTVTKEEEKKSTDEATVFMAGGKTSGTVTVVKTDTSGNATAKLTGDEGKTALKVMGGEFTTDSASASDYVADGSEVDSSGKVTESTANDWSLTSDNAYSYMLSGKTKLITATGVGTGDSINLKYDKDNKTFGIPGAYDPKWDGSTDARKPYGLAKYTLESGGGAIKIEPVKPREGYKYVKVSGTGLFDNTIVTLTAAGEVDSLGLYVDATDNKLAYIKGGKGKDSIKAGDRRTTLDGGENDDTLDGGSDEDIFIYNEGNDVINNYTYGTDTASIADSLGAPINFDAFDGSNFTFKFDNSNTLKFNAVSKVALNKGSDIYTYEGNTNGSMNYIAHEKNGISLGSGYSGDFNGTRSGNDDYKTIDATRVNKAIRITGNDNPNYIVASSVGGGTILGGEGDDTLTAAEGSAASLRFEGGAGSDSLVGGGGYNVFVYTEGDDKIKGYHDGDLVNVRGVTLDTAEFDYDDTDKNIILGFGSDDSLTLEDVSAVTNGVSVQSGSNSKNIYIYKKDQISHNKSVTLTSGFTVGSFAAGDNYDNINAVKAGTANGVSISGNDNNNYIYGSSLGGGTLYGGAGNDTLDVNERDTDKTFVLQYTGGKDVVNGFVASDKLEIEADKIGKIAKAKSSKSNSRLAFTFDKSNVLTFNSDGDEIGKVLLNGDSGFLTKDGVVSISGDTKKLDLFESSKGRIDLTEAPYADAGIASVNADKVTKQSVTLVGGTDGGTFTFAGKNKKKDQFEYNGGTVSISGYEAGKDRLDLNTAAFTGFSVGSGTAGDVSLGAGSDVVVLKDMQGHEVLLHHADSKRNSFRKMVFKEKGVILNKEKRPTMATIYSGANYSAGDSTVKKIFIADGASNLAITAGDKNKTTLDASASNGGVTLTGGKKNDKLIGSTSTVAADTFIYTGGKDIIQNYSSSEEISLGSFKDNLFDSKINAGSRSIKFKFSGSSKNSLTIKPAKGSTLGSALNISGFEGYTFAKNAIARGTNVSLTSEFSGSYRLKNSGFNNVDGHLVEKNLTFRGTSDAETLSGGKKKTTFKGGGGNDNLIGGTGNDVFFYAKGDSGNATIADFDFNKDKLKIAGGTITKISTVSGGIQFDMNNGRKNSANIASFKIGNIIDGYKDEGGTNPNSKKAVIKTNGTYYWFADEGGTDASGNSYSEGALITSVSKVSKSDTTDYAVIDLGYSSNLVNAGVATKVDGKFTFDKDTITKNPTNNG